MYVSSIARLAGTACAAAAVTIAALFLPAVAPADDLQFGGAQLHLGPEPNSDTDSELRLLREAGANAFRIDAIWSAIETQGDNVYNKAVIGSGPLNCAEARQSTAAELDHAVCEAAARGLKPLLTLFTTPRWARQASCVDDNDCAPQSPREYGEIARHLAQRYAGMLAGIEIWNEPDCCGFLIGGDDSFKAQKVASMTRQAYYQIHTLPAAQQTRIVTGALEGADAEFLRKMYDARHSIDGYFDAISFHPYGNRFSPYDPRDGESGLLDGPLDDPAELWDHPYPDKDYGSPEYSFISGIPAIRNLMVARGDGAFPIWITEFGWSTCTAVNPTAPYSSNNDADHPQNTDYGCLSQDPQLSALQATADAENRQGRYIRQAFQILDERYDYVNAAFLYELRNSGRPSSGHPAEANCRECQFGVVHQDFAKKPGYSALQLGLGLHGLLP